MNVAQIIKSLNEGSKVEEVAEQIGVSRNTLYRHLKKVHYVYDNYKKQYVFTGNTEEKQKIDSIEYKNIAKRTSKPTQKKATTSPSKKAEETLSLYSKEIAIAKEETQDSIGAFPLTNEEIAQLRALLATADTQTKDNDLDSLYTEVSQLPDRSKVKKYTVEIDERIYNDFDKLAKKLNNKRIGKATLVEIALSRLVRDFS